MKQCANPACSSYQEGRQFDIRDIICPRCGEPLQIADSVVDPSLRTDANPYGRLDGPRPAIPDNVGAALGAVGTLLLVLLMIWALAQLGAIGIGGAGVSATATPLDLGLAPALRTERAAANVTHTALATPIGGLITDGGILGLTPIVPLPTPIGQGGTTTSPPDAGGIRTILCKRLDAGQQCDSVTTYGPRDAFYLGVETQFGANAARVVRVRWYGPPNGEAALLNQDQILTPDREGRFWVGFSLTQSQPWATGVYRADIYLNDAASRSAYAVWDVRE